MTLFKKICLSVILLPLLLVTCSDFSLDEEFVPEDLPVSPVSPVVLSIVPDTANVSVGGALTFSASGGTPPYAYSMISGDGGIDPATGVYTAPAIAGTAAVKVEDSAGLAAAAAITINPPPLLVLTPLTAAVRVGGIINFQAHGGDGSYAYSVLEGAAGGDIDILSGIYTAPFTAGTYTVRVTDGTATTDDTLVTVVPASELSISPALITVGTGSSYQFAATGGVTPYAYSVYSGGGSVDAGTGVYTAPGIAGTAYVRVTDNAGAVSDSTVSVVVAGGLLAISPDPVSIAENATVTFAASGGTPPYTFSIKTGEGTIHPTTGVYTAIGDVGVDVATVKVTDDASEKAETKVTILPAAPTNLFADGLSPGDNSTIDLSWTDNSSAEDNYIVERKVGVHGVFALLVDNLPANTTAYSDTGITSNDLHIYRVRAKSGMLLSPWSNEAYDFAK